jgi:hypothetical protein
MQSALELAGQLSRFFLLRTFKGKPPFALEELNHLPERRRWRFSGSFRLRRAPENDAWHRSPTLPTIAC